MPDSSDTRRVIESAIRLGIVGLVAYACFQIVRPFVMPMAWGVIIAVAIYPLHLRLASLLGGRARLSLVLIAVSGIALLMIPAAMLMTSLAEAVQETVDAHQAGTLVVPPPPGSVAEWPVIGERLFRTWAAASANLEAFLGSHGEEVLTLARAAFGAAAGAGGTLLHFVVSILIAAVLMAHAESGLAFAENLGRRLAGEAGTSFAQLSIATIRSVAQGVLGIAVIQALLAGIGMLAVGIPGAGLWALLVLVLAVMQLPPLLVLGPAIAYVFTANATLPAVLFATANATLPAVLFAIYGVAVSASDTDVRL